jgi:hypothetical protein
MAATLVSSAGIDQTHAPGTAICRALRISLVSLRRQSCRPINLIMNRDAVRKIGMTLLALPLHVKIVNFASFPAHPQADKLNRLIVVT